MSTQKIEREMEKLHYTGSQTDGLSESGIDRNASGSCLMVVFSINDAETSSSAVIQK
jgi:hypothetical protein